METNDGSKLVADVNIITPADEAKAVVAYQTALGSLVTGGKVSKVPLIEVSAHPDNPRRDMDTRPIKAAFAATGYDTSHPITVSKRKDGSYVTLRGHRRLLAASELAVEDAAAYKRCFPDGKIIAVVHSNLTEAEEICLLLDHSKEGDRKPLDPKEEMSEIKTFLKAGVKGRDAIAKAMGLITTTKNAKTGELITSIRGSYVQPRLALLALPDEIQREFVEHGQMFGGERASLRQQVIMGKLPDDSPGLKQSADLDRQAGEIGPDGFGPRLKACWAKLMAEPVVDPDAPVVYIVKAKVDTLLKMSNSRTVRRVINWLSGGSQKVEKFPDIDAEALANETAVRQLAGIATVMGPADFAVICEKADAAAKATEAKAKEVKATEAKELVEV